MLLAPALLHSTSACGSGFWVGLGCDPILNLISTLSPTSNPDPNSAPRRLMKDRFFQFSWRPRNVSLLTAEQERDILKNLKKYSEKFAKDDDIILQQVRGVFRSLKANMINIFVSQAHDGEDTECHIASTTPDGIGLGYP